MSARKGSDTEGAGHSRHSKKSKVSERADGSGRRDARGGRSDVGRALRSAYDDTLREPVPDDLLKLVGKLA